MNAQKLLEGLKANYQPALHPTEVAEKDFLRTLQNMGYSEDQLDKLYDELLRACDYFPKVFNIHDAVSKLALVRPNSDSVTRTRDLIKQFESYESGMAFQDYLQHGGYEQIWEDCEYDEAKFQKRLRIMGVVSRPNPVRDKEHPQNLEFITDGLPEWEFPIGKMEDL